MFFDCLSLSHLGPLHYDRTCEGHEFSYAGYTKTQNDASLYVLVMCWSCDDALHAPDRDKNNISPPCTFPCAEKSFAPLCIAKVTMNTLVALCTAHTHTHMGA